MSHYHDDGMLRMPSPHDPNSGWTPRQDNPGYARGEAPGPAPAGKVFIPGMNTYVDADIAAELGLSGPQGAPSSGDGNDDFPATGLDPRAIPAGHDPNGISDPEELEISDAELEALKDQLDDRANREPGLSPTLDDIAECFDPAVFEDSIGKMVVGDLEGTLDRVSEATGLDRQTASDLIETTVMEAAPIASEYIGGDRWDALVYAASSTDDPFARRVVTDVVTGKLAPSKLANAYGLWWHSLPDADED